MSALKSKFQVVATYKSDEKREGEEFIAIMEGVKLPIYVITYSVDMTQFVFADPIVTDVDPLDHSIPARAHAQYIANHIAEEGKLSVTMFQQSKDVFRSLIRHHELASVEYASVTGKSTMPLGLEKYDVYFIR